MLQLKEIVLAYHEEAVWRDMNYVPPFKEYLKNGSTSSCSCIVGLSIILVDTINYTTCICHINLCTQHTLYSKLSGNGKTRQSFSYLQIILSQIILQVSHKHVDFVVVSIIGVKLTVSAQH